MSNTDTTSLGPIRITESCPHCQQKVTIEITRNTPGIKHFECSHCFGGFKYDLTQGRIDAHAEGVTIARAEMETEIKARRERESRDLDHERKIKEQIVHYPR